MAKRTIVMAEDAIASFNNWKRAISWKYESLTRPQIEEGWASCGLPKTSLLMATLIKFRVVSVAGKQGKQNLYSFCDKEVVDIMKLHNCLTEIRGKACEYVAKSKGKKPSTDTPKKDNAQKAESKSGLVEIVKQETNSANNSTEIVLKFNGIPKGKITIEFNF